MGDRQVPAAVGKVVGAPVITVDFRSVQRVDQESGAIRPELASARCFKISKTTTNPDVLTARCFSAGSRRMASALDARRRAPRTRTTARSSRIWSGVDASRQMTARAVVRRRIGAAGARRRALAGRIAPDQNDTGAAEFERTGVPDADCDRRPDLSQLAELVSQDDRQCDDEGRGRLPTKLLLAEVIRRDYGRCDGRSRRVFSTNRRLDLTASNGAGQRPSCSAGVAKRLSGVDQAQFMPCTGEVVCWSHIPDTRLVRRAAVTPEAASSGDP